MQYKVLFEHYALFSCYAINSFIFKWLVASQTGDADLSLADNLTSGLKG